MIRVSARVVKFSGLVHIGRQTAAYYVSTELTSLFVRFLTRMYPLFDLLLMLLLYLVLMQISSSLWYRLSVLLNFLPTESDLAKIGN